MLNGYIFLPGDSVHISDIGSQPANRSNPEATLVCVTKMATLPAVELEIIKV